MRGGGGGREMNFKLWTSLDSAKYLLLYIFVNQIYYIFNHMYYTEFKCIKIF